MNRLTAGIVAEFLGVFALMFIGGGAIIVTSGDNLVAIAVAHGLALAVMISAAMHISGGQFNPAVSLGLMSIGKQDGTKTVAFIMAQLAGAVAAAAVLQWALPADSYNTIPTKLGATLGRYSNVLLDTVDIPRLLVLEGIATFFLMFTVIGSAVDSRGVGKGPMVGGFAIGLAVTADILCIGPATGASMNPARSFGPALIGGYWDFQWAYWVAPIVGAIAAAQVWQHVLGLKEAK